MPGPRSQPPLLRVPSPALHHKIPACFPKRRKLNMRIYWTRGRLAREAALREPPTTLLHFSQCLLLLPFFGHVATRYLSQATGSPGSPACQVILAIFLALCRPQSPYPPWEVVTFLSKDRAGPTQSPRSFGIMNSMEANGVQIPSLSVSRCTCCSFRPLSLSFHPAQTHSGVRASDPREPGSTCPGCRRWLEQSREWANSQARYQGGVRRSWASPLKGRACVGWSPGGSPLTYGVVEDDEQVTKVC